MRVAAKLLPSIGSERADRIWLETTCKWKVIQYDQIVSNDSASFHVPIARWANWVQPPHTAGEVHGLIRDFMFTHGASISEVGSLIVPPDSGTTGTATTTASASGTGSGTTSVGPALPAVPIAALRPLCRRPCRERLPPRPPRRFRRRPCPLFRIGRLRRQRLGPVGRTAGIAAIAARSHRTVPDATPEDRKTGRLDRTSAAP